MRIAMFTWESLHSICVGGVGVHVTELAAALERKGHEVHVFTRSSDCSSTWNKFDGVYYHYCPFNLHHNFVDEINNMCRSFVDHFFEVENVSGPFDIVHAHDWLVSNAAVWAKEGRQKKMVLTMHSTEYGRCGNHFFNSSSERIRNHECHGAYVADKVITVSNTLRDEVSWIYQVPHSKMTTIYNGIHASHFDGFVDPNEVRKQIGVGPMDPMMLFAGRLTVQKGPDILIRAIPMVLHHYPNAKFVFAGDGEQRGLCESLARELGVSHAIRFLGFQKGDYLKSLFKACDGVVVPSRNEPFGIVVLEAWSAGKPVVATQKGGPREFVTHGVTGYQIFDHPESVAWGVGTLFQNFDQARWMGSNGRHAAETAFGWDRIAEQTEQVYSAALN